MSNGNISWG